MKGEVPGGDLISWDDRGLRISDGRIDEDSSSSIPM